MSTSTLQLLHVSTIAPDPTQPRRTFDQAALDELAASIKAVGVIEPVIVRQTAKGFQLIAGERRWRAAKLAGVLQIPAVVRDVDLPIGRVMQLAENQEREPLRPLETAQAYANWLEATKRPQAELAKALGKTDTHVSQVLGLLKLPKDVKAKVDRGELSFAHARALVPVAGEKTLLDDALDELHYSNLSSKELERYIANSLKRQRDAAAAKDKAAKAELAAKAKAVAERDRLRHDKKHQAQLAKERAALERAEARAKKRAALEQQERDREAAIDEAVNDVLKERTPAFVKAVLAIRKTIKLPAAAVEFIVDELEWNNNQPHNGPECLEDVEDHVTPKLPGKWRGNVPASSDAARLSYLARVAWTATLTPALDKELRATALKRVAAAAKAPAKVPARKGRSK